jgi:bifunctional non-homologous end joining protein LigD
MPPSDYLPQLASLVTTPPAGPEWLHEIKLDGYRIGCRIAGGDVRLISRSGRDWTARFPEIADAARALGTDDTLIDGEVVMVQPDGRTSFEALQAVAAGHGERAALVYFGFDLLRHGGARVDRLPLEERKTRLRILLGSRPGGRIRYTDHIDGLGEAFLAQACRLGLEGIVSKRRDLPYLPGRRDSWRKTKCVRHGHFVIGGFTDRAGTRDSLGALLVGAYRGRRLSFAGRVGTGFSHDGAQALRQRLADLAQLSCPFDPPPQGTLARHAHWVTPALVCEVAFIEWTDGGALRHPFFQGLVTGVEPSGVRAP